MTKPVLKKAELLNGRVDSVNVTDNQTAIVRLSSLAACSLLKTAGLDPVLQVVVRDRNRIALQSDILGAAALALVDLDVLHLFGEVMLDAVVVRLFGKPAHIV